MTGHNPDHHDRAVPCFDPECLDEHGNRSTAEPEQDGEHRYHACTTCGYTFGYHRVPATTITAKSGDTCAVGIPEDLRRSASAAMQHALDNSTPLLQIGRRDAPTA